MTHVPHDGSRRRTTDWCSLQGSGSPVVELAWLALVAVAVAGRLWQPEWQGVRLWNVTPLTAIALAAGALFPNRLLAAAAPLGALALSNFFEPEYGSWGIAAAVYAASAWPVLFGGLVNRHRWAAVLGGAAASSLVFFVATNLAHWAFTAQYEHSAAGLAACFAAALPFYRPLGDVGWSLAVFAGIVAVREALGAFSQRFDRLPAPAPARRDA